MYLKEIDTVDMECAFELYQIPDYVLETVPEDCRGDITGAVYDVSSGELGEVYLTESNRPYDNYARYHEPSYWQPAPAAPKSIDHGILLDELTKLASAQAEGSVAKQALLQTIECIEGVPYAILRENAPELAAYSAMLEAAPKPPALSDERIFKLFLEKAVDKGTAGIYDFARAIEREILG